MLGCVSCSTILVTWSLALASQARGTCLAWMLVLLCIAVLGRGILQQVTPPRISNNKHLKLLCIHSLSGRVSGANASQIPVFCTVQSEDAILRLVCSWSTENGVRWLQQSTGKPTTYAQFWDRKKHWSHHHFGMVLNQNFPSLDHLKDNAIFQSNLWLFVI